MTQWELDRLVAQIGEEILARVGTVERPPRKGSEGLNLPGEVCPGCVQRCAQTCAHNTRQIIAAGADRVSASERLTKIDPAIAAMIDHTILKADATRADVTKVCREARQYGFASVCVNPYWVPLVRAELAGTPVKVCTVVGFPLGATSTEAKVAETAAALRRGRAGNRHGDQRGRAALGRSRRGEAGYPAGGEGGARGRRHRESDSRNGAAGRPAEGRGLHAGQAGRRGFREDFHRFQHRRAPRRTTWR